MLTIVFCLLFAFSYSPSFASPKQLWFWKKLRLEWKSDEGASESSPSQVRSSVSRPPACSSCKHEWWDAHFRLSMSLRALLYPRRVFFTLGPSMHLRFFSRLHTQSLSIRAFLERVSSSARRHAPPPTLQRGLRGWQVVFLSQSLSLPLQLHRHLLSQRTSRGDSSL